MQNFPTSLTISVKFYLSQLKPSPSQNSSCFSLVSIFFPTQFNPKYWIYQIICKAKPIEFAIKLHTDHDTLWVKHATHQKAESLRTASPSNLDKMVSNSSNLNAKYAEFSTKWQMLLHFHNPSCGYNQRCNLYQETVPVIQSILASLFHHYLFTKSSLKSPLTLPSYINQKFFSNLFLRTTIPIIYTKNIFFTSKIMSIQVASRYQEVREYCED